MKKYKSPAEKNFAEFLQKKGIGFECNLRPDYLLPEVDFLLSNNLIIEIDGRDFHNKKKDFKRDQLFKKYKFKVIRVPASNTFDEKKLEIVLKDILKNI